MSAAHPHPSPAAILRRARAAIPRGGPLPPELFRARHRALIAILWLQIAGLIAFGAVRGHSPTLCVLAVMPAAVFGLAGAWPAFRPRVRASFVALGLLSTSAALVLLWDGTIEAHFHFFVMLALVALYADWVPYGLAVGFVFLHHGLLGNSAAAHALHHPGTSWRWALVHTLFVAAASAATVASWRQHEAARAEATRRARVQAALRTVAEAVAEGLHDRALFDLVAAQVAAVMDVELGFVGRYEGDVARVVGAHGVDDAHGFGVPLDEGTAFGRLAESGHPSRIVYPEDGHDGLLGRARRAGLRSAVAAPIAIGGAPWGGIVAGSTGAATFAPDAEDQLADFAELVGLSVANAAARAELETRASSDPLTGLANHGAFHDRVRDEVERSRRHGRPLALVLIDVDHFKRVNDTHGHQAGDAVLVEFARRLRGMARAEDVAGRLGGEEFAMLLPDTDAAGAARVAERLLAVMRETPFPAAGRVTASAGVCDLSQAPAGADDLLRLADAALYWSKNNGRDMAIVYAPEVLRPASVEDRADQLARQRGIASLRALAARVEARHPSRRGHSERVADLAVQLATVLGWGSVDCARLRDAALLHDVGKIGVPDGILLKSGPLDDREYAQVKGHVTLGAQIVSEVLDPEQVRWVRHHHERIDGGGYPDGLAADRIPGGAALIAVADAWDSMTADRPHRAALDREQALAECRRVAGGQLDAVIVEALARLIAADALDRPPAEAGGRAVAVVA